jgi:hypothetical protein
MRMLGSILPSLMRERDGILSDFIDGVVDDISEYDRRFL